MRATILVLGLLLCQPALSGQKEERVHEFAPSDLNKGTHAELKVKKIANFDVAHFSGNATVTGTFVAEWTVDTDEEKPTEKAYTFDMNDVVARSLPHWRDYVAGVIYIDNGTEALAMFAGEELAGQFEQHLVSKVSVKGTLTLSKLQVWVECDAANAKAVAVAAKNVKPPLVESKIARVGCNGPYDVSNVAMVN